MAALKRKFKEMDEQVSISSEPSAKKARLNESPLYSFQNKSDQEECDRLFQIIDKSPIVTKLRLEQAISKQIAEYSTGYFESCGNHECGNHECGNDISILNEYKLIYANNHENAQQVGYKHCSVTDKYYCCDCMHQVKPCHCVELENILSFIPSCDKCNLCQKVLFDCDKCCAYNQCDVDQCQNRNCQQYLCAMQAQCVSCGGNFCSAHSQSQQLGTSRATVCHQCYDKKVISCDTCQTSGTAIYTQQERIYSYGGTETGGRSVVLEMIKCRFVGCREYICLDCDDEANTMICKKNNCGRIGYVCGEHKSVLEPWDCGCSERPHGHRRARSYRS